jgi:hypothetical protein
MLLQRVALPTPPAASGSLAHPPTAAAPQGQPPTHGAAPAAAGLDLETLVEKTCARLFESLAIEQERRGVSTWL